eukprot:Gb_31382 [translate_table: standard]
MGRSGGKKKRGGAVKRSKSGGGGGGGGGNKIDKDLTVFLKRAQEFKEEGNKQFQGRNYIGAMEQYEKALKLVPSTHRERAFLHSNKAVCLMQIKPVEYDRAVDECTLALDVNPHYNKALLRRAKAYETLGKFDLSLEDVEVVLQQEPNNKDALEIADRVRPKIDAGIPEDKDQNKGLAHGIVPAQSRALKLIYGHDIRLAQMPANCKLGQLREIVRQRYPSSRAVLIKCRDSEGDLVTITTTEELKWAEASVSMSNSLRLYVVEVDPAQEPLFEEEHKDADPSREQQKKKEVADNWVERSVAGKEMKIDKWLFDFGQLFRTHLGIDPEAHIALQDEGMELCSQALEETATSEEAQCLFEMAASKFQEIAALALLSWGNVHFCAARKRIPLKEKSSKELVLAQLQAAYDWAQEEYSKAGQKYEEALRIKPDLYDGLLALGQQQFESGKLVWSLALASKVDLETWDPSETLRLFSSAEEKMQRGTEIWEKLEEQHLNKLKNFSANKKEEAFLKEREISNWTNVEEVSAEEAAEHAAIVRSQINLLWGSMLFEHSHIEFKLGLPIWEEHLDAAIETFKLAGASETDVAVVLKNHSSNANTQEGLGFKVDEIVQAWNDMCEAKRLLNKNSSARLEPLLRRKVPRLHEILENVRSLWH